MTKIVTLSFDDGFLDSSLRTADIFERFGLQACMNVLSTGLSDDAYQQGIPKGDFSTWNELQARGHEIMPHGYDHANLTSMPFAQAKDSINNCLDMFEEELDGFSRSKAIFNFPYNASNEEIEKWLSQEIRAFRTSGQALNVLPNHQTKKLFSRGSGGPEMIDQHLNETVDAFLAQSDFQWLLYNMHGLDNEGWGPISTKGLELFLARMQQLEDVDVLTAGQVLDRYQTMAVE